MNDKYITVVFRLKTQNELVQMENDPRLVAFMLGDQLKERYFCQRCGRRITEDSIHTCTPPAETRTDWSRA